MKTSLPRPPWHQQLRLLRNLLSDPQPVLDELRTRYGPVIGLGGGPMRLAIVGDPAALHELFRTPTDSFRWGHKYNALGFVVGETSMIVSDGDAHHRRRASVQTALSRRRLNHWVPMIVERTDAAVETLASRIAGGERHVDLYPVGRSLVLEIVVRALFGERMAARTRQIGLLFERPQAYLESPTVRQLPHRLPFTARARVRRDRRALDALIDAEIEDRRSAPIGDPLDVLEALVLDGSLSPQEIRDQVVTLMGAGYDTTAASLAWMVWCAALQPGLWNALRREADDVFGPLGADPRADDTTISRLELSTRVMRETLRLHPAGAISPRETAVDVRIGDHAIRRGTLLLWSAHLAGRDPLAWPDPLRFDPDRHRDASPSSAADGAWVPFGRGARNCIGFALAQMELTLIAARLAQRLDVAPVSAAAGKPRAVGMVVNRPAGGVPMRVSMRG